MTLPTIRRCPGLFAVFILCLPVAAQVEKEIETPVPQGIDDVITALYRSVCFEPGMEPDWGALRGLMLQGAVFVQPPRPGEALKILSTEGFIELFKRDLIDHKLKETGFCERVVATQIRLFGNIAHGFVVFEARRQPDDPKPAGRGLDSIQLVREGDHWRIASITTELERPGKPLPTEFLTPRKG